MAQRKGILRPPFRHIRGTDNRLIFGSSYLPGRQIAAPDIDMYDIFSGKTAFTTLATSAEICYIDLEIQQNNVLEGGFILHIRDAAPGAIAQSIRIDTHADNKTMQHLIEADGFTRCGIIYIADGTPRIAYQWTAE